MKLFLDQTETEPVRVSPVEEAAGWARKLTVAHSAGPNKGDYGVAMEAAATSAGVAPSLFWSLHYKQPKRIWADAYLKIKAAYDARYEGARQRQMRKLIDEIQDARKSGADAALVSKVLALAGIVEEEEGLTDE